MKEVGILNADIISRSGHRDEIIVYEKECINDVTSLMVLLKNQGAHTESISISPEFTNLLN